MGLVWASPALRRLLQALLLLPLRAEHNAHLLCLVCCMLCAVCYMRSLWPSL